MAAVVRDLEHARRRRHLSAGDVFDRLYDAYLTLIGCIGGALLLASVVGDHPLGPSVLHRIETNGATWAGVVITIVLVAAVRSGARGGPLALERPFIAHVLLSPVPRTEALRGPALDQLRHGATIGFLAGAGLAAAVVGRLPYPFLRFVALAGAGGLVLGVLTIAVAMVFSGHRLSTSRSVVVGLVLVLAMAGDLVASTAWSPGAILGRLFLGGGVRFEPLGLLAVPLAAAVAAVGVRGIGGMSLEAATRRAGLVSELRFAVARQDLRTVVLLQRRLAQDRPRAKPWLPIGHGRNPVFRRGLRSIARLPAMRLLRPLLLTGVAAAAAVAVWDGTTLLVVVAALALWAAALDLIEPLAQELDHPTRWAEYPGPPGRLLVRHLVAPATVLVALAAVPAAAVVIALGSQALESVIGTSVVVLGAVVGAACSAATAPFDPGAMNMLATPEMMGIQLALRVSWPLLVAGIGWVPLLLGRAAQSAGTPVLPAEMNVVPFVVAVLACAIVWLSRRTPRRL